MTHLHKLMAGFLWLLMAFSAESAQLANYLGTGHSPRIKVVLSVNGPKWEPFSIDYQQIGNIASSSSPTLQWSTWDVKDTENHYYGTVTINSDGKTASWVDYKRGTDGYYLEGIHFTYNSVDKAYQLTVDKVHGNTESKGPFPTAPLAKPAEYSGTDDPIILSVEGTQIISNIGKPVLLKGMVRPSLEWNPQGEFLSEKDLERMDQWGINVIRIDLNQNYWFASKPVTTKGSYKQIINALIYYAIRHDLVVILDLHWTEDGHQSPMANKKSIQFWKEVAQEYKQFGTVIFELFNEPYSVSKQVWLNGDTHYAGYQQLYDAVRSTGAQNICIINGLDYGYDVSFINTNFGVKGSNIVYGSHPYNEKGSSGWQGPGGSFEGNFAGIINKYPIIFTEFGVNQENYFPNRYARVYDFMLRYINENRIHYSAFAWWVDPTNPNSFPDLIKDWTGIPLNGGINIKNDLKTNPPTKLDFD